MIRQHSAVNDLHFNLSHTCTNHLYSQDFHAHETFELFYFADGEIQYYIEEDSFSLVPGDVLLIPPGLLHRPVMLRENVQYERYVLNISVEYVRRLIGKEKDHFMFTEKKSICFHPDESQNIIKLYLEQLLQCREGQKLRRDALTTLILLELREIGRRGKAEHIEGGHRMQEVIRYINAHFTEEITLEEIADRFFISKYHLLRRFKSYTHATVHQYILSKRMVLAKALLREGVSPQSTALSCGFSSYTGFYQAFCREVGTNPADFQHRES